jgi:hypothetical protein
VTSRGFASEFRSTSIGFDVPGDAVRLRGRVRGAAQLEIRRRVGDAARTADRLGKARRLEAGRYDLLLSAAAIAGPSAELEPSAHSCYGWLAPLAAHASGEWVRLGLSRHRPGQPVFPRSAGDPMTLASDGTLDLAPLSAPFGELGEPVRRFEIVRAGVAAGLALDHREAALARATPNGGVRNLVLSGGATGMAGLSGPDVLEIDELGWLDVDPRSGVLTAGIRLGQLRGASVAGGLLVVGNVFDLLGRARLSSETVALGWYRGPKAIRIDGVDIA